MSETNEPAASSAHADETAADGPPPLPPGEGGQPATHLGLDEALNYAVGLHKQGFIEGADQLYGRILEALPEHADALNFRGMAQLQMGKPDLAVEYLVRAAAAAPQSADIRNNLGNVLQAQDRFEESLEIYQQAIALRPDYADAYYNAGRAYERLERYDEALTVFQKALFLYPYEPDLYRRLGATFYCVGRISEAAEIYDKWAKLAPGDPYPLHMRAACTGNDVPSRAHDTVVQRTFDNFAESFDKVLERLKYRAPELIGEKVAALFGFSFTEPARDVLDLGCGTGLCAPLLKPGARRLVGVDLSPAMLEKARARGGYDDLVHSELIAYLEGERTQQRTWDLMVAADVFCYIGDLQPVFEAAFGALRRAGRLIFTAEAALDPAAPPFVLHPHGRYSQREDFLRSAISAAGLALESLENVHLRVELKKPVDGFLVVARRPES